MAVALVVTVVGGAGRPTASAAPGAPAAEPAPPGAVRYRPPVDGIVIDPFRAPANPYGPGNRGLDYALAATSPVRASAAGEVVFAGAVAGTLHVTVRHADGLRTSYSFLARIEVRRGQAVQAGDVIGRSLEVFHFGVRRSDGTYLDPAMLFAPTGARLVPGGDDGAVDPLAERAAISATVEARTPALSSALRSLALVGGPGDLSDRTALWAHLLAEAAPATHTARVVRGLAEWARTARTCTPATEPAPRIAERRVLVEVGGIGSTSEHAAVATVDAATLGYAPTDVIRFSYAGGKVLAPAREDGVGDQPRSFAQIPVRSYTARDSQADLAASAARLAALLDEVSRSAPGVPIDVVAHSQGGTVARLALAEAERRGTVPAAVQTLVTLGAPHQGSDLASVVLAGRGSPAGARLEGEVQRLLGLELDAALPAGTQLAATSPVLADLRGRPLPPSVRALSIGARGDLVVTANRTVLPGAASTVVPLVGLRAHDELPRAPATTREIALAVAGRPPACRSMTAVALDLVVAERLSQAEAQLGLAAAVATSPAGSLGGR